MKRNTEKGVLILECIKKSDPGSEGRFLSHMFDLMEVKSQYVEVCTPKQLLSLMGCSPYSYIHITTHGLVRRQSKRFIGWWTPNGTVGKKHLKVLEGNLPDKVIISTACKSGKEDFSNYIVDKLGCKYYLAPTKNPKFRNSILFAHIFYHKLFVLEKSVNESYDAYDNNYKNPHCFTIYKRKKQPN